jgi:uncharacterized protein YbjT (DUF2867 family)
MRVAVLGAAGQLGQEVVRVLVERGGYTVAAVVRRPAVALFPQSVEVRMADALDKIAVTRAIDGCDAVVNVIGGGTLRRTVVASSTSVVAVAAAQDAGVSRYFAISAGMVALDWPLFKYVLRPLIFRHILAEHRRVEEIVRASALAWTIVRPSALSSRSAQGYDASLELQPRAFTSSRADVASFIADELKNRAYVHHAVFVTSRRAK